MNTFWYITELLAVVVENWIIYDFYSRFHSEQRKLIKEKLYYCLFIAITSAAALLIDTVTAFSGMLTLICIGIVITYGILFLKGTRFSKLFLPVVSFGLIFIINIFVSIVFSLVFDKDGDILFLEYTNTRFFCIITTKFIFFLMTRVILGLFHKGVVLTKQEWIMLSGISFISLLIATVIVNIGLETSAMLSASYILCLCGILCIGVLVFIMISQITKQNKEITKVSLLELQVSQQKQELEHMKIMQNKIRQCNHDHMNHLLCIHEMMKNSEYDEANAYLNELIDRNPDTTTATDLNIPNSFIKAILTVKLEQCNQNNIPIALKMDDCIPKCESADLCILMSNLLDNAIEASVKVSNPKIEIILSKQKDYYTIMVKNRIEKSVLKNNAALKTTKKDKQLHGIGIQSIREIVYRYQGMMDYYESDNWFVANVWLLDE